MKIGQIIHDQRVKMNIALEDLSLKIDLSKSALSDIERYSRMPRFDDMCAISEILGLDIKKVWKEIKDKYKESEAPSK